MLYYYCYHYYGNNNMHNNDNNMLIIQLTPVPLPLVEPDQTVCQRITSCGIVWRTQVSDTVLMVMMVIRPISLLRLSLLRFVDSTNMGNPPWT